MANVTDLANQVATLQATESARDARDAAIIAALKALPNGVLNPADQAVLDKAVADLGTLNTAIGSQDNS